MKSNAKNKTTTLFFKKVEYLSLNFQIFILHHLKNYTRTRYMHYVSHYWANCSNIFFKPPCIENIIKDVKAMLAYLLYTCNEIVDKV